MLQLLGEVRKLGSEINEPIEIEYLNLSMNTHAPKHKVLIPLSEIEDPNLLKHLKPKHKALIPLIIKYLHEFQMENFKWMMVSALQVKGFTDATETLIKEFHATGHHGQYKWSIGDAFSIIMDGRYEDQYIDIIRDKRHGTARQMVTIALGKLKSEKALPVLLSLLDDEDVNGHVVTALGYYRKPDLIKHIEPFLNHEKTWIRNAAKATIRKIEKVNMK